MKEYDEELFRVYLRPYALVSVGSAFWLSAEAVNSALGAEYLTSPFMAKGKSLQQTEQMPSQHHPPSNPLIIMRFTITF